ncbi:MAG: DUF86 domain-containing protein [Kiritimatiellae bacterium]|nr:DUF86 domain-containing protein [Kiritimatiellia bacterium]
MRYDGHRFHKNGQRLYHIIQAGERIFRSVDGISKEDFYANEDKQGNVVRCLEIIGEATNHLSEEITSSHDDIPWHAIVGMRNNLIHGYNEVNYEFVWATVQNDIRPLIERVRLILSGIKLPDDFHCPSLP